MRIVMLSQDEKIFDDGAVRSRMISYGTVFEQVTLIVFGAGDRREDFISSNVFAVFPGGKNKFDALLKGTKEAREQSKKINADIVSTQDPFFLGLAGRSVSKRLGIPLQVQLHTDCFSPGFRSASLRRRVESMIAPFVLRGASCVRVVSERVARSVSRVTRAPVSVLPIALPAHAAVSGPAPSEFTGNFSVLAVSRLSPEKQLHLLINAMKLIPSADLVIVGEGPLDKRLRSRVLKHGLQDRVRFTGWKDNLAPYYKHAAAFAAVSQYEGYGLSVAEAALHSLPIVSTDVGIAGDLLVDEKECLITKPNARDIARTLARIMEDPAFARELGRRAHSKIQGHRMDEITYLARYKEAMHTCIR